MNVIGVILGGGQGSRLMPLTKMRAKPAVPIAGKYRLVDVPISNCIHANIRRVFLLTQFNSVSLHGHVHGAYRFDMFQRAFVRLIAAQQTPTSEKWFQGTADAVRMSLPFFHDEHADLAVILSGDQLYRIDFEAVIRDHLENQAELTICAKPVPRREAGALGILQIDRTRRITRFVEKPGNSPELDELVIPLGTEERFLASMGIYVFNMGVLRDLLDQVPESDFGRNIIPAAIRRHRVFAHSFDDYWKDIGTIGMFWEENLRLTNPKPEFTFYDSQRPIYTLPRTLPSTKVWDCRLEQCLVSEGSQLQGAHICRSTVGIRSQIGRDSELEDVVMMGADFYDDDVPFTDGPRLGVGRGCHIRKAILDKNVRIGDGVTITPDGKEEGASTDLYMVRDGIICIPKNTVIPEGMTL